MLAKLKVLGVSAIVILSVQAQALTVSPEAPRAMKSDVEQSLTRRLEDQTGRRFTDEQKQKVSLALNKIQALQSQAVKASDNGSQNVYLVCVDGSMSTVLPLLGMLACTSPAGRIYTGSFFGVGISASFGAGVIIGVLSSARVDKPDERYFFKGFSASAAYWAGGRVLTGELYDSSIQLYGVELGFGGGLVTDKVGPIFGLDFDLERKFQN